MTGQARFLMDDNIAAGHVSATYQENEFIFSQGEVADSVFYIKAGSVKLVVTSSDGREALLGILRAGEFIGEGTLAGQPTRVTSAVALSQSRVVRFKKLAMIRMLREQPSCCEVFLAHLLSRHVRCEADLMDQRLNYSDKRLARALVLLAGLEQDGLAEAVIPKVSQETLAQMVGTTRPRISLFMNRFERLGFIECNRQLKVRKSLLTFLGE